MTGLILTPQQHAESLELACVQALSQGDADAAFQYADRRCRIAPIPQAYHHVLRAEALHRLEARAEALRALDEALAIAPSDFQANRRMMAWGTGAAQYKAAEQLLAYPLERKILDQATTVLMRDRRSAIASVRILEDRVTGWVAWNEAVDLEVEISSLSSQELYRLAPDMPDRLRIEGFEHSARIDLNRPRSAWPQLVRLSADGTIFHTLRASPNAHAHAPAPFTSTWAESSTDVTVIVPVYGDEQATRACLQSLQRELDAKRGRRAILVDDASPDAGIRSLLDQVSSLPEFMLLRNPVNLGFAASVNRALDCLSQGDVILLNADTEVPLNLIDRLAGIAGLDPRIGTLTPISNNGEFTSFPGPFKANAMVAAETAATLDQVAARVNRGLSIEIPNGIGFCLYITRSCLDAVGLLSQSFGRGYLEDVDFCLRARERGFKNVCAASVYVGHIGSRSFGADKRTLVVRNVETIEYRFPGYRQSCAAFVAADPLRAARAAMERALPALMKFGRLVVTGSGAVASVAAARARRNSQPERPNLLMRVTPRSEVELSASEDTLPQNLRFSPKEAADLNSLSAYLRLLDIERIELVDPAGVPSELVGTILSLKRPLDLIIADAGLLCPKGTFLHDDDDRCHSPDGSTCCDTCSGLGGERYSGNWRSDWAELARRATRILAPCPQARAFAKRWLPGVAVSVERRAPRRHTVGDARPLPQGFDDPRLGVVPLTENMAEFKLIREIAWAFAKQRPKVKLIVLGSTVDDIALMRSGNVFVSGGVTDGTLRETALAYGIECIFIPVRQPLFGHPRRQELRDCGLPLASFKWGEDRNLPAIDVNLDPALKNDQVASTLGEWLERSILRDT